MSQIKQFQEQFTEIYLSFVLYYALPDLIF